MSQLEKRSPQDLLDDEYFNESPANMMEKFGEIGIKKPNHIVYNFYTNFHSPSITIGMVITLIINIQLNECCCLYTGVEMPGVSVGLTTLSLVH